MKVTRKQFLSTVATGVMGAALRPSRLLAETTKRDYTPDMFSNAVGTTFRFVTPELTGTVDATLQRVDAKKGLPETNQFTLEFLTPRGELLVERSYTVYHDQLGELSIFLIPMRRDEQGHGMHRADFNILQPGYGADQNTRKPRTAPFRPPSPPPAPK
jgi:hypothetical protein